MTMQEITLNLHIHSRYSDGRSTHAEIARAALQAEVDSILVTDHNVLVQGAESYYKLNKKRTLLLTGEEIHDVQCVPPQNHLLVFGAARELAPFASDPQNLIRQVQQAGGLSFIAHPYEDALPAFHEPDISWRNWEVQGFDGLEIWNAMSELKSRIRSPLHALFYSLFPNTVAVGPRREAIQKWDELLNAGKRIIAIAGSDAHALSARMGPFRRILYPYEFHFRAINNHLYLAQPLSGDPVTDRNAILNALRQGHLFIGYDLPAPTTGFQFTAQGRGPIAIPGDEISLNSGITLQIHLPEPCLCYLIRNGERFQSWREGETHTLLINQPGVYRVECYQPYLGRLRAWIFSNPIYIRK